MITYKVTVDEYRTRWYNVNGQLHREDGPAIEYIDGSKFWYIKGKRHRTDGPAIEESGRKEWWLDGLFLTEQEFLQQTKKEETINIEGKDYTIDQIKKALNKA
jgi:hypothetical protein